MKQYTSLLFAGMFTLACSPVLAGNAKTTEKNPEIARGYSDTEKNREKNRSSDEKTYQIPDECKDKAGNDLNDCLRKHGIDSQNPRTNHPSMQPPAGTNY